MNADWGRWNVRGRIIHSTTLSVVNATWTTLGPNPVTSAITVSYRNYSDFLSADEMGEKGKPVPYSDLDRLLGLQKVEVRKIWTQPAYEGGNVSRIYPRGYTPGTYFWLKPSWPPGHRPVGKMKSMKNTSNAIVNRIHDLLVCSPVPQPTAVARVG